jgi:hypothetical protein
MRDIITKFCRTTTDILYKQSHNNVFLGSKAAKLISHKYMVPRLKMRIALYPIDIDAHIFVTRYANKHMDNLMLYWRIFLKRKRGRISKVYVEDEKGFGGWETR